MQQAPSRAKLSLLVVISTIASLSACTSLEQRKQWSEKRFGSRCEAAGYRPQTPAYFECISDEDRTWRINQMERGRPYEDWMPMTYLPSISDEKKE